MSRYTETLPRDAAKFRTIPGNKIFEAIASRWKKKSAFLANHTLKVICELVCRAGWGWGRDQVDLVVSMFEFCLLPEKSTELKLLASIPTSSSSSSSGWHPFQTVFGDRMCLSAYSQFLGSHREGQLWGAPVPQLQLRKSTDKTSLWGEFGSER